MLNVKEITTTTPNMINSLNMDLLARSLTASFARIGICPSDHHMTGNITYIVEFILRELLDAVFTTIDHEIP